MRFRLASIVIPIVSISALVLAWYVLGKAEVIGGERAFPTIKSTFDAAIRWYDSDTFGRDIRATLGRVLPGLVLGSLIGVAAGLLTGRVLPIYQAIGPLFHGFRSLPAVALGGFLILLNFDKFMIVAWGVFFPVWINTHEGAGQVDDRYIEVGRSLGFSRRQMYTRVILPASAGYITAGVRQAIAMAYVMVFIAEWLGANRGVGYQLSIAHVVSAADHMVVGLFVLGSLAFLTDAVFRFVIAIALPWLEKPSEQ